MAPTDFFLIGSIGKKEADSELWGDRLRKAPSLEEEQDPETSAEGKEERDLECPDRLLGTR